MSDHDRNGASVETSHRHTALQRLAIAGGSALSLLLILLLAILGFRLINPPITPVMIAEKLQGEPVGPSKWVRLEDMSPELPLSVIAAEDSDYCSHWGVSWGEVWNAIDESRQPSRRRYNRPRGASTIPMQTVKKLYLWDDRSYLRKALEVPLAYVLSALWSKQAVLETYLNIIPWGPGVVGAEKASQEYFKKGADDVNLEQATKLAAAIRCPNLKACNPSNPGRRARARARGIERDVNYMRSYSLPACVLLRP